MSDPVALEPKPRRRHLPRLAARKQSRIKIRKSPELFRHLNSSLERGARYVRVVRRAEAPAQTDRLCYPDAGPYHDRILARPLSSPDHDRPIDEARAILRQLHAKRLRELAWTRAEILSARAAAPGAHRLDPGQWLQCANQHSRTHAGRLAHCVQQRVNAIGAVHICNPRLD